MTFYVNLLVADGIEPISDPKSLDSGGPHGLVFQESTGKYVHRHELEGKK